MTVRGAAGTVGSFIIAAGLLALAGVVAVFGLAAPVCMCAAPPPGHHEVTSVATMAKVGLPPLAVFLVAEFFALAPVSRRRRIVASTVALLLAASTFAVCMAIFWPCCGEWAPVG